MKNIFRHLLLFSVLLFVSLLIEDRALATEQMPDKIIYKDKPLYLYSNPLDMYLDKAEAQIERDIFRASCTACWRGYFATWEMKKDGYLYLVKLGDGSCTEKTRKEIPISKVFPKQKKLPVKATWFSGTLRIAEGELLWYRSAMYGQCYEKETFLTIEEGKLKAENTITNTLETCKAPLEMLSY